MLPFLASDARDLEHAVSVAKPDMIVGRVEGMNVAHSCLKSSEYGVSKPAAAEFTVPFARASIRMLLLHH